MAKTDRSRSTAPSSPPTPTPGRLIPVPDWPNHHPWPPVGGLRHIRFFAKQKGAAHCFVKVGKRVLIDEAAFLLWCRENGGRDA